jgi:hypothetical protein
MAKAPARPKAKKEETVTPTPGAHDAPGLSPFERTMELARRLFAVPKAEVDRKRERAKHTPH